MTQRPNRPKLSKQASFKRKVNDIVDVEFGHTRLMQAILANDHVLASDLLESGASPDKQAKNGKTALHLAAAKGHVWAIDLLSKHGAQINTRDKELKTALFDALSAPNPVVVLKALAEKQASADIPDKEGKLPLHIAAETALSATVAQLLSMTQHPDRADKTGYQPLHYACESNGLAVVQRLVEARVPLHDVTLKGDSCLHIAALRSNYNISNYLLATDAVSLVNATNLNGRTPLHIAAADKKDLLAVVLIRHGADPNAADVQNLTPLYEAAKNGNVKLARKLIALGADVATRQKPGTETPLMASINHTFPNPEMTQLLLDHRADVDAVDKNGYSALMLAAYKGHEGICNKLLDKNADATKTDFIGRNVLHHMDEELSPGLIRRLIKAGADMNQLESYQKKSPLMVMIQNHNVIAAHVLIESGAALNLQNTNGHTALHYALKNNHADIARKLLDKNADFTLSESGTLVTPLHVAAQHGHCDIFERLVKMGADPETKDSVGGTPLHHALMNGLASINIITTILKHGGNPLTPTAKGYTPYDYAYSDNRTTVTALFDAALAKAGKPRYAPRHPPRRYWWGGY